MIMDNANRPNTSEKQSQNKEIERKFTIKELPEDIESYPYHIIEQGYLCTSPVVRIRRQDDDYFLTYKGGGLLARTEYNLPLTASAYTHLKTKIDGNIISKKRYLIPLKKPMFTDSYSQKNAFSLTIELDIFAEPFAPLIMAEVEFPDLEMANAFIPPEWFLEDVTMNPEYHNSNMSLKQFD